MEIRNRFPRQPRPEISGFVETVFVPAVVFDVTPGKLNVRRQVSNFTVNGLGRQTERVQIRQCQLDGPVQKARNNEFRKYLKSITETRNLVRDAIIVIE